MAAWELENDSETTAAEVSRNFGRWQSRALRSPVTVTHHGRPRIVMLAAGEFERLSRSREASPGAPAQSHRGESSLRTLMDGMSEGFLSLNAELRVLTVNTVVEAFLGMDSEELVGQRLEAIQPPGRGAVFLDRLRWVLRSGEVVSFEATSFLRDGPTLSVRAFPFCRGVGVVFTNLTEITALRDQRAEWKAQQSALDAEERIGAGVLNAMGYIVSANPALTTFLGLNDGQLGDMRLIDMVAASERPTFSRALHDLAQGRAEATNLDVEFLTRSGRARLRLSLAPKIHDMVCEGFYIIALP